MKELGFFILFSFLFHFFVSTTTLYLAQKYYTPPETDEVTQIEIIDPNQQSVEDKLEKTRQLIRRLKATVDKMNDPKVKARFESETDQRVIKETKARNLGLTQNQSASKSQTQTENETSEKGDLPEFARAKNPHLMSDQNSAISVNLANDIQESDATNLNTDANIYYSFYNRVEELFYVRWVERVNFYWDRISADYKKTTLAGKVWSTQVEIWLTATGQFHSAYIKKSSGYGPFDESAVFAFKDAKFFPNPPKAKVESDGFVRLRYRFNVHVTGY